MHLIKELRNAVSWLLAWIVKPNIDQMKLNYAKISNDYCLVIYPRLQFIVNLQCFWQSGV